MNVPVIVSDVRLMKQFVLEHQIGLIASNETEFTNGVLDLFKHPEKREELVANCRKYTSNYTWEKTIKLLLEKYKQLA